MGAEIIRAELENKLQSQISPIENYARNLVIKTDDDNIFAAEKLKIIKAAQKQVTLVIGPVVTKLHEAWKEGCKLRDRFEMPLKNAEQSIKQAMLKYSYEIEAERRRLQAKADAKARAEEEKKRKELEARVAKAAEAGKAEKAQELLEKAADVSVVAQVVQIQQTKPVGVSYVDDWDFEVSDISLVPREYLILNEPMVRKIVKASKGALAIPGIKAVNKPRISSKAA